MFPPEARIGFNSLSRLIALVEDKLLETSSVGMTVVMKRRLLVWEGHNSQ